MPPTRSQRSAVSLDALRASVRAEFGPGARIVAAERVSTSRYGGLVRRFHYEATVEVPDPADDPVARVAIAPRRAGIMALLAEAEDAEDALVVQPGGGRRALRDATAASAPGAAADDAVVNRSEAFASLMDDFTFNGIAPAGSLGEALGGPAPRLPSGPANAPGPANASQPTDDDVRAAFEAVATDRTGGPGRPGPAGPAPVVPAVRRADGDLVALVGRAPELARVRDRFGLAHGLTRTDASDRRSGILARAGGVQEGVAVLAGVVWPDAAALEGLAPDQAWVVVDAGRKHEDTRAMVRAVAGVVAVAGLVVVGESDTTSPETVHTIGLPVLSF